MNIYYCIKCHKSLEDIAKKVFLKDFQNFSSIFDKALPYHMKSKIEYSFIYIIQEIECNCKEKYISVWYSRFFEEETKIEEYTLVHVNGSHYYPILGLHKRPECRNILHNLFNRWQNLATHIYWVTPFIGTKDNQQFDLEWLIDHIKPFKTTIVTRKSTSKVVMKLLDDLMTTDDGQINVNYINSRFDIFGESFLKPFLIKESIETYQNFHAKFYAAIFPHLNKAEVVETSFNIQKSGEHFWENLSMRDYPIRDFIEKFLKPLQINPQFIPESVLEQKTEGKKLLPVHALVIFKENNQYSGKNESCYHTKWEFLHKYLPDISSINFSMWK